ncbi:hypothetical protein QBC47DRAFT_457530 [Echria macrotheca]|uniref:Uncharacterized protein n=1 Tax=Echria macrotheca TaxID=438768 RepID=A0AAJ0F8L5_9PEZI|nr:hypothetical protein QBC47DRAFT_457530 [Echria macrotheca]
MAGDGKWLGSVNTTIIVVALAIGLSWVVAFILWGGVQKTSRLVHDYRLRKGWTKEKIPEEWLGGPRPMPDYVRNQKKPLVFAECGPRIAPRTLSIRSRRSVADLDPSRSQCASGYSALDLDANRPNAPSGTWRPLTPIDSSLAEPGPSRPGSIHVRNSHADPSASQSRGLHRNSDARFVRPPSGFRVASDYDEPSEVFQVNGVHYDRTPLPEKALDQLAQAKYMGLGVPTRRDSVLSVDSNGNPPAPESDERRRTRRVSFADTAKAQRPTEKRPPLNRWMTHDPDRRGSAPTQTMPNYPRENRPPSTGVVPHDPDRRGPASTQVMPRDPGRKGPVFTGVMPSGPTTRRPSPHRMMLNGPNGNRPPLNGMPRDPERGRPGSTQMTPDHPTTKHPPSTGMMSNGLNGTRPPPAGMMPHDPDRRVRASNGVMSNGPRGKQPASNGAVPHDPDRRRPSFIETRRPSFTETRPPDGSKRKRPEQAD